MRQRPTELPVQADRLTGSCLIPGGTTWGPQRARYAATLSPAVRKPPPAIISPSCTVTAETLLSMPDPSVCQEVPFQRPIRLAV